MRDGLAKAISNKDAFSGDDLMDVLAHRLDIKEWSQLKSRMYEWTTDEFGERHLGYAEKSKRLKVLEDASALVGARLK